MEGDCGNLPLGGRKLLNVDAVLARLTLQEKISLLTGTDNWHLYGLEHLGIPVVRVSDGPNGVRGTKMFNSTPAACLPCGTALAATWDVDLIRKSGQLQAQEAIAKGVSVILGPTTNMQRSPLGGRGFESFSEDPVLAGWISAAAISGIQSKGVAATLKHFICNDQEHERMSQDSRVSERALREIYALPFQIAHLKAAPWAFMSSYNKVNGLHASESYDLLQAIIRDEWGFDGLIMSDWRGTYSTAEAIKAGLDLEMPGPTLLRGSLVNHALICGKLTVDDIDICVRRILAFINQVMPLNIPTNAPETTINTPETAQGLRELGAASIVLLKNDNSVLPFRKDKSIAIIGPNSKISAYSGGGSASLHPYYAVTPFDGISSQAQGEVYHSIGCTAFNKLPPISDMMKDLKMLVYDTSPSSGTSPRQTIDEVTITTSTDIYLFDYLPPLPQTHRGAWYADFIGSLAPNADGEYFFSLSVAGTARLFVGDELVVDAATEQVAGGSFYGYGTTEVRGRAMLKKGSSYTVKVEFGSLATSLLPGPGADSLTGGGIRIGCQYQMDAEEELAEAVELAKRVDQVVIVAGLNSDWESEGYDRATMGLPGRTNDLINAVLQANANTAIVIQSGTPVSMPWATTAPAIMQAWYGGNETGNAIADILYGDVNPSGKLPLTFPLQLEDNPTYLNFGSERGRTIYGEDIYIGYRFYESVQRDVCFAFGYGLSYTEFALGNLAVSISEDEDVLAIEVMVENVGSRSGAHIVQVYVSQRHPSVKRPVKELKGFAKVCLDKSEKKKLEICLSLKYATSFWDERKHAWAMEKDAFDVHVGSSSVDKDMLTDSFEVSKTRWWNGLPNFRFKLPSRNWMIFLTITGSFAAAVTYDRRQKKRIQQKWSDLVAHISKETIPVEQNRRKLTIFLSAPPGDGLRSARDYFIEYVKPVLVSAALDYEVIEGKKEGEIRAGLAEKIRAFRRKAGEKSSVVEEPSKEAAVAEMRRQMGITDEPGPLGDIVIGRHTWKEYIRGLHEGWLGPLDPPPPPPEPTTQTATELPGADNTFNTNSPTASPENAESSESTDAPTSEQVTPKEPEEEKKPKGPTPAFISPAEYSSQNLPVTIPRSFEASLPVPFPHLLGILNTPVRIYRYLTKRHLADAVGQEVAAAVLASASRPYHENVNPAESGLSTLSDPSNGSLSSDPYSPASQQSYEQQSIFEHEEQEWPKAVRKAAEARRLQADENDNSASVGDDQGKRAAILDEEREWIDDVVLDPRIASRMHRYVLAEEEQARANRIAEGQEWILGQGEKPEQLSVWQRLWIDYGYGEDPELAKRKPIIGNLDNEDGE
ncbi:hypothetical protein UA08_04661 [Talaromyces atroroseus]|uniref:beta-glucosidase n=1 Tax=Talaromyces atroroseus TaxID=1441469 RepID=A0A225ARI1_TALAT|nr:hypothetical protein UA08_04661 [Talaromyces atroroseus]OKL59878.1 hypothetical protein UA08_04661 [Talaromyces atroroseus]